MDSSQHVLRNSAIPELGALFSEVSLREMQAALIEYYASKAGEMSVHEVIHQYENSDFTAPCTIPQREIVKFEGHSADVISDKVEMIALSPVISLGSNSVLAGISQKMILATARNTEVVADGVTALTLEVAKRLRQYSKTIPVDLGTFHRELRTQKHVQPGFTPHFHALSLVSSETTNQYDDFKKKKFSEHISIYLNIIDSSKSIGYKTDSVSVLFSNLRIAELLIKNCGLDRTEIMRNTQTPGFNLFDRYGIDLPRQVTRQELKVLIEDLPSEFGYLSRPLMYMSGLFDIVQNDISLHTDSVIPASFDLSRHAGIGYYEDLCAKISAQNIQGDVYPLVDIGTNVWLSKLTNNKNTRLITGGMGTELFMKKFKLTVPA